MPTYTVSRYSSGDWLYPATIEATSAGIRYIKHGLIGGREEEISYEHIASVRVDSGLWFASMAIETTGGSAPIIIKGLRKRDAAAIAAEIRAAQRDLKARP